MSGQVEITVWPEVNSTPEGHINPGAVGQAPFAVLGPLGRHGSAHIQFWSRTSAADQARYLRALAEVATRLADELDAEGAA